MQESTNKQSAFFNSFALSWWSCSIRLRICSPSCLRAFPMAENLDKLISVWYFEKSRFWRENTFRLRYIIHLYLSCHWSLSGCRFVHPDLGMV